MTDTIFVFASPVESCAIPGHEITYGDALNLFQENLWGSSSRGAEYLTYVDYLLDGYPGFGPASYLTEELSILQGEELLKAREAIEGLIKAIRQDPATFASLLPWSAEDVGCGIDEATVSSFVDAEERHGCSQFFSFLVSQIAALDEAQQSGRCLVYARIRP